MYLNTKVNAKNPNIQTKSTTLSKIIVPKDLSTGTFSTPYKAVERANSPLLGMVRFIKYPKEIVQRELELEIW